MDQPIEAIARTTVACKPYRPCIYNLTSGASEVRNVSEFVVVVYDAENYERVQSFGLTGVEVAPGQFVVAQPKYDLTALGMA